MRPVFKTKTKSKERKKGRFGGRCCVKNFLCWGWSTRLHLTSRVSPKEPVSLLGLLTEMGQGFLIGTWVTPGSNSRKSLPSMCDGFPIATQMESPSPSSPEPVYSSPNPKTLRTLSTREKLNAAG